MSSGGQNEPDHRGRTVIGDRVIEKIAQAAALETSGCTPYSTGLPGALAKKLPDVEVAVAGSRAVVTAKIAALWPGPLGEVANDVSRRITDRVSELAGVTVDSCDVIVTRVVADVPTERRVS